MKNLALSLLLLVLAAGCTSRDDRARTAADVWHMGKALEIGHDQMESNDLIRMGVTLQKIGDRWSEDLGIPLDKDIGANNE